MLYFIKNQKKKIVLNSKSLINTLIERENKNRNFVFPIGSKNFKGVCVTQNWFFASKN